MLIVVRVVLAVLVVALVTFEAVSVLVVVVRTVAALVVALVTLDVVTVLVAVVVDLDQISCVLSHPLDQSFSGAVCMTLTACGCSLRWGMTMVLCESAGRFCPGLCFASMSRSNELLLPWSSRYF